jgi:hypothetical protein
MSEEVMLIVKIPIRQIADDIRDRHMMAEQLFDVKLEAENLVLSFKTPHSSKAEYDEKNQTVTQSLAPPILERVPKDSMAQRGNKTGTIRRRRRSTRNRMKTRGWQVVGKILNSKGQTAIIYRPFVQALFGKQLTPAQQR